MYPPQPKPPHTTWDIQQVLDYWQCQPSNQKLNLTQLARKTVMLILLSTCRWKNELLSLSVKHMYIFPQCITFYLMKLPKTFTQGTPDENTRWLSVRQADQSVDNNLCPVRALTVYLAKTRRIQSSDSVFVTSTPPYSAIKPMTLNSWILQSMKQAGIDTSLYTAYSTRHASSSGALKKGMPLDEVLRLGCWKTPSTFIKHYNLPILKTPIAATSTSGPSLDTNTVILPKVYIPRTRDHTARKRQTSRQTHTQIAKIRAKAVKKTQVRRTVTKIKEKAVKTVTKIKEKAVKTLQSKIVKPTSRDIILSILSPQQDVQATELNIQSSTIEQEVTIHTSDNKTPQAQESEPVQGGESVQITLDLDPPPAQDIEHHEPDFNLTMDESDMEIDVTGTDNLEESEKMSDEQLALLAFGTESQMLQATEHPVNPQHGRVAVYTNEQFILSDHAYTTSPQVHAERRKLARLSKAVEEKEFEECFQLREYEGMLMRLGIVCEWRSTNRTHLNIPIIGEDGLLLGFHKQIQTPVIAPRPAASTSICLTTKPWQTSPGEYLTPPAGKQDEATVPVPRTLQSLLRDNVPGCMKKTTHVPPSTTSKLPDSADVIRFLRLQPFLETASTLSLQDLRNTRIVLNIQQSRFMHKTTRLIREHLQERKNPNLPQNGICVITMITLAGRQMNYNFKIN